MLANRGFGGSSATPLPGGCHYARPPQDLVREGIP